MVVDSSAVIEILKKADGYTRYFDTLVRAPGEKLMSAGALHETAVVWLAMTRNAASLTDLYQLLDDLRIEIVPFDTESAKKAAVCYSRFGKGIHPPGLNIVDCAVYALAADRRMPVLSTSDEFVRAGLTSA
jgi:ribonuclease VapC